MIYLDLPTDTLEPDSTFRFFGFATAIHVTLFLWNPVLFRHLQPPRIELPAPSPFVVMFHPDNLDRQPAARPVHKFTDSSIKQTRSHPSVSFPSRMNFLPRVERPSGMETLHQDQTPAAIHWSPKTEVSIPVPPLKSKQHKGIPHVALPQTTSNELSVGLEKQTVQRGSEDVIASIQNSPFPIDGPLAHRKVVRRVKPEYPAWAEEQGITGSVRLYFTVTQMGRVGPNIRVEKTSGSVELDRKAMEALAQWLFSPSVTTDNQWGIITFNFSL